MRQGAVGADGQDVPETGFRPQGSFTLASDDAELTLLKQPAALPDAGKRGYELLDQAAARALNPALRGYLQAGGPGYTWLPGREATEVRPGAVRDHTGAWHAGDLVVLCPGAAHTGVAGSHLAGYAKPPVRRVRLQMLQTDPLDDRLTTSVADGDSLRYYPAYDLPGRELLPPQQPVAAAAAAQLLLVQRLDGSLTVGDTHGYDEPFPFDVDETAYEHLRGRAELLLGASVPPTRLRWAGVYSQVTGEELYHRSRVAPGAVLVTGLAAGA